MSSGQFFDSRYPRLPATPQAQAEQLLKQIREADKTAAHMVKPGAITGGKPSWL
jgi:hypothetical protein